MFDEKEIAEYRATLPSEEVKQRILEDLQKGIKHQKTEKIFLSRVLPIAASFALVLVAALLIFGARSSLVLKPHEAEQEMIALARVIAPTELRAEAKFPLPTEISVPSGKVTVTDAETGELLGEGNKLRVHGNVLICWQMEAGTESSGELTLSCLGFTASYKADDAGNKLIRTK